MLIDATGSLGSIGGGHLEWHASRAALELLSATDAPRVRIEELVLGPDLGQCCGGRVTLWLERLSRDDLPWLQQALTCLRDRGKVTIRTTIRGDRAWHQLCQPTPGANRLQMAAGTEPTMLTETVERQRPTLWMFGAGHVGQALVRLLSPLSLFDMTWIDSRPELLPADLPETVTAVAVGAPARHAATAPAGTRYVVLTHDHALDYELCRLILARRDAAWLGLIGSASKAARFRSRLRRDGMDTDTVGGLTCPIGVPGVASKLPAAIAIAIAAQLLQQPGAILRAVADEEAPSCGAGCASCGSVPG